MRKRAEERKREIMEGRKINGREKLSLNKKNANYLPFPAIIMISVGIIHLDLLSCRL